MKRKAAIMDKTQYLEEIKSTTENCYNIGYKCGYEAAIENLKKIIANMHVDISAKMINDELLGKLNSVVER